MISAITRPKDLLCWPHVSIIRDRRYFVCDTKAVEHTLPVNELISAAHRVNCPLVMGLIRLLRAIQVRMNAQEEYGRWQLCEVKTAYSKRTIKITQAGIDALADQWQRQQREKATAGATYNDSLNLVFANRSGGIIYHSHLTRRDFKLRLKAAGIPETIRYHDLRHTCATLLIAAKVPVKVVSELLGHADIAITLRIYAHVLPDMQQEAVSVMDMLLASPEPRKIVDDLGQLVQ